MEQLAAKSFADWWREERPSTVARRCASGWACCPSPAPSCPVGSFSCSGDPRQPAHGRDRTRTGAADVAGRSAESDQRGGGRPGELIGRSLRYFLTIQLVEANREVSVAELGERLAGAGLGVAGRTSKVISDALRWEIRRGRVQRTGRGRYVACHFPRQTEAWMRRRLEEELTAGPPPVRSWPVVPWRAGWSSIARGRALAASRAQVAERVRTERRRLARRIGRNQHQHTQQAGQGEQRKDHGDRPDAQRSGGRYRRDAPHDTGPP